MINIFFEDTEILDLDPEFFVSWLNKVCLYHKKVLGEVTLVFCSDEYLLEINKQHLDHDYYTDIITFDYSEQGLVSGDLFISVDRVLDNAGTNNVTFAEELNRVVVHGVLHLIGFSDKSELEQVEMTKEENRALSIVSRGTI